MYVEIKNEYYQDNENLFEVLSLSGEIIQNGFETTNGMLEDVIGFERKSDILWNSDTNKFQNKTNEQIKYELAEKQCNKILKDLQPLMMAMNFQENGKNKGADPTKSFFTDTEIKEWSEYVAEIANNNIDITIPVLSDKAKKRFNLNI